VNILTQSVYTATIGENTFYLGSSLLKDYIREEDDNKTHTLLKDFTLPDGMNLNIQHGKTLHILENVRLTINKNNEMHIFGTLYSNGKIVVYGGRLVNHSNNTLILDGNNDINFNNSLDVSGGHLENDGTLFVTNNGSISLSNSSIFTNDYGCTCTIENAGNIYTADTTVNSIYNYGIIYISDVFTGPSGETGLQTSTLSVNYYGILNNVGTINVGLGNNSSSNNANAELVFTGISNGNAGIININYNTNDQIVPQSNNVYATNSVYLNTDTNPNGDQGVINDNVSSTVGNNTTSESMSFSVYNVTYNSTNSKYSFNNVAVTDTTNFPTFITVNYPTS